ncbi:hypothetical protein DICPUDRAFT_44676 [Dictyostelium purpureum]|uniref:TNFR-Cys domain-containing protein n=1 Tax=Dictyostelium purpureum TaxID=5786 RepID=F0Z778_DICPU|nr:uncharacterized protein DICPUDRAFT_44676 [Dictyostelium purpureum]EGC40197.1 hypothetical protein DICPUDRAFT_44676 [Dictyostelium purpureum]|eukprot:XP_003283266.1 hypothetical protein DICPUDRAFT_44676 [Dictyostelium purpureum]
MFIKSRYNKISSLLIILFYFIINTECQQLNKDDIDNYFKNYPFGVRSNNGVYVKYAQVPANGTILGFSKNGSADFPPIDLLPGSYLNNFTGIVEDHLGPDGRPVYTGGDSPYIVNDPNTGQNVTLVHNSTTFYEWFHSVQCVNYPTNASLYLAQNPQEFVLIPQNYSYPYGTKQDPLPYFQNPTYQISVLAQGRNNVDPHISIITNWLCFFFIDNVKQTGVFLEGPGNEDVYYYDYSEPFVEGKSLKIDLFCASRYTGDNGIIDISFYNTFQNFTCGNLDSCGVCGFNETCGCNKGPISGCSRANEECQTCSYINDCGYVQNDSPLCQTVMCTNNQTCVIEPISCDDGNPCTEDSCSNLEGCVNELCPSDNLCLNGTCISGELTPCQFYKCGSNQICVEDFSSDQINGVPKCVHKKRDCMDCNDLDCPFQNLYCKYIEIYESNNCNGHCKDKYSCCNYQPVCF